MFDRKDFTRRDFIRTAGAGLFLAGLRLTLPLPAWAATANTGIKEADPRSRYDLSIGYAPIRIDGRQGKATAVNDALPGPLVHLREGDDVILNVTNELMDTSHSSIHWHGILVPFPMDGVPGVNFAGIQPGETYKYRYRVRQAGTYWYHSHSRFQEQTGTYGPLIIDPKDGDPFAYDRDYPVVLSDWSFEDPETIFRHINLMGHYYNFQRRTLGDFISDVGERGFVNTAAERLAWGKMRMSPVDLAGVTASTYTYLMNGHSPDMNWTALFDPGETVRLRFINASTMSNYDVRIPGLDMEVVMADGKAVRPVAVHEFRIGVAETYDVLVRPREDRAFTIFAESLDRSGYTRGTLAPEPGMTAAVPSLRRRPVRRLEDIGMGMMDDNILGETDHGQMNNGRKQPKDDPRIPGPNGPAPFLPDKKGSSVAMVINHPRYRLDEPGIGLGDDG
jgi:CopA family copper-resistance protein